jgi:hypothetical protein
MSEIKERDMLKQDPILTLVHAENYVTKIYQKSTGYCDVDSMDFLNWDDTMDILELKMAQIEADQGGW